MTDQPIPQVPSADASIVNRLFDFFTSDKFYRTLPEPEPKSDPPVDPRVESLESELSALKEQLAQLTAPKPEPELEPEPEPDPKPGEIPTEPPTAPLNVGGDELNSFLAMASRGDRRLGEFYQKNSDAIFDQIKRQLQEA
jgi:hypothetical protein